MPDTQYFTKIDGKYVKDAEAREQLNDLEDYVETITPVPLSVDSNGTYTAPTGVFGYSPVTVNVPTGAEIISKSDWDAMTTAQKQAKGLVAIQDSSTGFKRGDFVNGADYIDTLLTYSNYSDILEEDKSTSHVSGTDVWGNLTLSGNMSNDADGAVVTNNGGIFFDLTAANTSVTLYFLAKVISAPSSISTITAIPYSESYGNMPNMYGDGTNVYAGAYGSGTLLSGIVSTGYHLYTVALDTTSKIATFYADGERYAQLQFSNSGDYIAIGTATKGLLTPLSLAVKYIGIVNGHEDMLTILNNQSAIMGAFGL